MLTSIASVTLVIFSMKYLAFYHITVCIFAWLYNLNASLTEWQSKHVKCYHSVVVWPLL